MHIFTYGILSISYFLQCVREIKFYIVLKINTTEFKSKVIFVKILIILHSVFNKKEKEKERENMYKIFLFC